MKTNISCFAFAVVVTIGLGISHYLCYRQGQTDVAEQLGPGVGGQYGGTENVHLILAMKALRPIAEHPDAISAADRAELVRETESYIRVIEEERIPEFRQVGNDGGVSRHENLVREARALLVRIPK